MSRWNALNVCPKNRIGNDLAASCWEIFEDRIIHLIAILQLALQNELIFQRQEKDENALFILGALRLNGSFLDEYTGDELPLHFFPSLVSYCHLNG